MLKALSDITFAIKSAFDVKSDIGEWVYRRMGIYMIFVYIYICSIIFCRLLQASQTVSVYVLLPLQASIFQNYFVPLLALLSFR